MALAMSPVSIYRGQWKALRLYSAEPEKGTRRSRLGTVAVYILPISSGVAAYICALKVNFGDTLIAVMGVLAGALIAAFSQLANWRQLFTGDDGLGSSPERWLLDCSIAHILAGAYSAILVAIFTLLSMVIELPELPWFSPWVHRIGCVVITVLSTHVVMSILMALPNLYSAYVQINHVPPVLNGQDTTE